MSPDAHRLPAAMGSAAALAVTFIGFLRQIPPGTCFGRAVTAFAVFAALGIIIRYLLDVQPDVSRGMEEPDAYVVNHAEGRTIQPGTQVGDLLQEAGDASSGQAIAALPAQSASYPSQAGQ